MQTASPATSQWPAHAQCAKMCVAWLYYCNHVGFSCVRMCDVDL